MKKQIFVAAAFIIATMELAAQTATADGLKTRTKSNNTNEKTIQANGDIGAAPKLTAPAQSKVFTASEIKNAVTFRWTPVVPKPKEGVTYRLKVWQLMQGQNSTQAMRTNKPIVTKDVMDVTQATVSGIYTGPCKPPYLCDFIWTVEAIAADGKPITEKGTQETYSFSIEKT